jgi:hypothetical protein
MKLTRPIRPASTGSRALTPTAFAYHVTNAAKLKKYQQSGAIFAPVAAFTDVDDAVTFRRRHSGRTVLLKFPLPSRHFADPSSALPSAILCQEAIPFSQLEEVTG